jgi:hypothetical protein
MRRRDNRRVRDTAERLLAASEPAPYLCECNDPGCIELVHLTVPGFDLLMYVDRPIRCPSHGHELEDTGTEWPELRVLADRMAQATA